MKKVSLDLFEKGDHVMVTSGYNKGKVGTVRTHISATANVVYELAGATYRDSDEDDWDDEYYRDYEDSPAKFLKFITKAEYDKTLKKLKILTVPGLPVSVKFLGANLIIGDNVITPANAKKMVEFITDNTNPSKKKKTSR